MPAVPRDGALVSNLGGPASTVTCPWCDGTGLLIPGHDAQAAGAPAPLAAGRRRLAKRPWTKGRSRRVRA